MNEKLNPHWIVGFVDGEGAFCVMFFLRDRSPYRKRIVGIRAFFTISQKEDAIVKRVKEFFGFGIISRKTDKYTTYAVSKQSDVKKLRDFFLKYPLQSQKRLDFEKWSLIVDMIGRREHHSDEGLIKIARIREEMNLNGKRRAHFKSASEIERWLEMNPRKFAYLTQNQIDFIKENSKKMKPRRIASILGCHSATVSKWIRRLNHA